jgi:hypothetical protein
MNIEQVIMHLRSPLPPVRDMAAHELAKYGEPAVPELIRMVEGRRRGWISRYTYEDQLAGISALGETGSQKALDYLRTMYQQTVIPITAKVSWTVHKGNGHPMCLTGKGRIGEHYRYPNVRGSFRKRLEYTLRPFPRIADIDFATTTLFEDARAKQQNILNTPAHATIRQAISKLELALEKVDCA